MRPGHERDRDVARVFGDVVDLDPSDRSAFLDANCPDPGVRAEVEDLLGHLARAETSGLLPPIAEVPTSHLVGKKLGPYTIQRLLGHGGMGSVYEAEREDLAMRVALKIIRQGRFATSEELARFLLEGRILARMSHPHIAAVLDAGVTDEGVPYLVMEYLENQPIDEYCESRKLGLEARLELITAVCDAVDHAHKQEIIHRDIKPGNILVDGAGRPRLVDFGIAKDLAAEKEALGLITRTGDLLATPQYAAPEQLAGGRIDRATDIYALGLVLYKLITGEVPTRGMRQRLIPIPSAVTDLADRGRMTGRLQRLLTGGLDTIVMKAVENEPDRRYASAGALAEDLRRYLEGRPIRARPRRLARTAKRVADFVPHLVYPAGFAAATALAFVLASGDRSAGGGDAAPEGRTAAGMPILVRAFEFRGPGGEAHLADAIELALRGKLDGLAHLRVPVARHGPDDGGEAHLELTGTVSTAGNRLLVEVVAASSDAPAVPLATVDAAGLPTDIPALAEDISRKIIARLLDTPAGRLGSVAASSAVSFSALRAYLRGRAAYADGRYDDAVDAFQAALAEDSTFALAHYELGRATNWAFGDRTEVERAMEAAYRHRHSLLPRDQRLISGYRAWRLGRWAEAERTLLAAIDRHPDDVEAWTELGEVQLHGYPFLGRPPSLSREAWSRVLVLAPGHLNALRHLWRVEALERRAVAFDSLVETLVTRVDGRAARELRPLRTIANGSPAERSAEVERLLDSPEPLVYKVRWLVTLYTDELEVSRRLSDVLADSRRDRETRIAAYHYGAVAALAAGQLADARRSFERIDELAPGYGSTLWAFHASAPFYPLSDAERSDLVATMLTSGARELPLGSPPEGLPQGELAVAGAYAGGLLAIRLGDISTGREARNRLHSLEGAAESAELSELIRAMQARLSAHIALAAGDTALARASFLEGLPEVSFYLQAGILGPGSHERFTSAEIARAEGRLEDAIALYRSLEEDENILASLPYRGPARLGQARALEALGRTAEAKEYYRRFIELWAGCDAELVPLRTHAERALAGL